MSRTNAFFNPVVFIFAIVMTIVFCAISGRAQDAASLYKAKCVMCHGADGKADTAAAKSTGARSFSSPEVQKETDAELTQITTKGKAKMPAYENKLTAPQITQLVSYVRELGKK